MWHLQGKENNSHIHSYFTLKLHAEHSMDIHKAMIVEVENRGLHSGSVCLHCLRGIYQNIFFWSEKWNE